MLILDDDRDMGALMQVLLKQSNVDVTRALTLKDGISNWAKEKPPIILLDNNFPDGQGVEMIEMNQHLLENCKVIMATADTQPGTRKRALHAGIHYFVEKPFHLEVLRELINEILSKVNLVIAAIPSPNPEI